MSSELTIFENTLKPLAPQFNDVLAGRMPAERLMRTLIMACEKTPKLLQCSRQSLLNASMTFGVLALEVDGVTGQGYILPFKGTAQPVIGFKGYNTIAARSRITITGDVVREGDVFDFDKGEGWVKHRPKLDNQGRIIAAWSKASALDRPAIVEVLGIGDLEAVRKRSPGAKMAESPWNDPLIGLPAMYSKTVKRRLARSTPMEWAQPEFHQAARMDEAFDEQGRLSHISPTQGVVIEGAGSPIADREPVETPGMVDITGPKPDAEAVRLQRAGDEVMRKGVVSVRTWWLNLTPRQQHLVTKAYLEDVLKPGAEQADLEMFGEETEGNQS